MLPRTEVSKNWQATKNDSSEIV